MQTLRNSHYNQHLKLSNLIQIKLKFQIKKRNKFKNLHNMLFKKLSKLPVIVMIRFKKLILIFKMQ